jgi:hypothetical protein
MSTSDSHDISTCRQVEKLLRASGLARVPEPQLARVLDVKLWKNTFVVSKSWKVSPAASLV